MTPITYRLPTAQELLDGFVVYRYKQVQAMSHREAHAWSSKTPAEILAEVRSVFLGKPYVPPLELKIHPDDYTNLLKRVYGEAVPDPLPTHVVGIALILDEAAPRWHEIIYGVDLGVLCG